jgi:hypothetical protein
VPHHRDREAFLLRECGELSQDRANVLILVGVERDVDRRDDRVENYELRLDGTDAFPKLAQVARKHERALVLRDDDVEDPLEVTAGRLDARA